jgi:hypothetical protein
MALEGAPLSAYKTPARRPVPALAASYRTGGDMQSRANPSLMNLPRRQPLAPMEDAECRTPALTRSETVQC